MGCNPQESLENTINTMTLFGVHPSVPWDFFRWKQGPNANSLCHSGAITQTAVYVSSRAVHPMAHLVPRLELRELRYQWARTWQDKFQHYGLSLPSWANQQAPLAMPFYNQESEGPAITSIRVEDSQVLAAGGTLGVGSVETIGSGCYWFSGSAWNLPCRPQPHGTGNRSAYGALELSPMCSIPAHGPGRSQRWQIEIPKVADL